MVKNREVKNYKKKTSLGSPEHKEIKIGQSETIWGSFGPWKKGVYGKKKQQFFLNNFKNNDISILHKEQTMSKKPFFIFLEYLFKIGWKLSE